MLEWLVEVEKGAALMDYYTMKALLNAGVSLSICAMGIMLVDSTLKNVLTRRRRLLLYVGVVIILVGLMPVGRQIVKNEEWKVIKLSADYHDTIAYHRERWNSAKREKDRIKDADRLPVGTTVPPTPAVQQEK